MKTSELQGTALDWAVAKCEGHDMEYFQVVDAYLPSTDWAQGGLIIEQERISLLMAGWDSLDAALPLWEATSYSSREILLGNTPLVAAMRCYVASKMGDEIELPEEA